MKTTNVVLYFTDVPKTTFANHKTELSSWDTLKTSMIEISGRAAVRKLLTERKLVMRVQMPDKNYSTYLADVLSMCA